MRKAMDAMRPTGVDRRFVVLFLLYLSAFLSAAQSPFGRFEGLNSFTASVSALVWGFFSIPVVQSGPFITMFSFPMEITQECTGLHYAAILGAGILAYRSHSWRYRLAGIVSGGLLILALNVLRIGVLGIVGEYARNMFEIVHAYLWEGAFAVIVFAAWLLWVTRGIRIPKRMVQAILLSVAASLLAFWIISGIVVHYAVFLATLANALPTSVIGPGLTIGHDGSVMLFETPAGTLHSDLSFEINNGVLLAFLCAISIPFVRKGTLAKRSALSGVVLCLQHLTSVVLYGALFARGAERTTLLSVLWIARGFALVAPVLIWGVVSRIYPDKAEGDPVSPQPRDGDRSYGGWR